MKAIVCGVCGDIRALRESGSVKCECGNVIGWWVDPQRGTVKVYARDMNRAKIMGIMNSLIMAAFEAYDFTDEKWRKLHDRFTDAPGYLFDKSHRGCPVVMIGVGNSSDTEWADSPPPGME